MRDELLAKIPGAEKGRLRDLTDESIARALPRYRFSTLHFPEYPVARVAPAPLKSRNLLIEPPRGPARALSDAGGLQDALRDALAPVTGERRARDAVRAWLLLAEGFHQDGFFQFAIPDDAVKAESRDGAWTARGTLAATRGGKGEIALTLAFDREGKLAEATTSGKIRPGVRPICQATKLLDGDPVVRQMAERDILVMGRAAEGYLDEQRARAAPELREAIDRLWRRILDEGW
jgi:hypothetical protein